MNCVPLHVQDGVSHYFDEALSWETFSVRDVRSLTAAVSK